MSMAEVNLTVLLAGAPRTGTQSMAIAMHMLGYKVLHTGWHRDARAAWCRYFRSDWGFEDAVRTLEGFDAVLDEPVMHAHEEIMERFPSAKLVLTVRDSAEQWYDRMHAFRVRWAMDCEDCTVCERALKFVGRSLHSRERSQADAFKEECTRMEWAMFGCDWRTPQTPEVRARCVAGYRRHVENITRATPRERLLVFNVKDGWAPLCDFLGVPRPEAAFPAIDIFREPAVPVMTPCVKLLLAVAVPALFLLLICCCWRHRRRRSSGGARNPDAGKKVA